MSEDDSRGFFETVARAIGGVIGWLLTMALLITTLPYLAAGATAGVLSAWLGRYTRAGFDGTLVEFARWIFGG